MIASLDIYLKCLQKRDRDRDRAVEWTIEYISQRFASHRRSSLLYFQCINSHGSPVNNYTVVYVLLNST